MMSDAALHCTTNALLFFWLRRYGASLQWFLPSLLHYGVQ
jgi:hypothetical protein